MAAERSYEDERSSERRCGLTWPRNHEDERSAERRCGLTWLRRETMIMSAVLDVGVDCQGRGAKQ